MRDENPSSRLIAKVASKTKWLGLWLSMLVGIGFLGCSDAGVGGKPISRFSPVTNSVPVTPGSPPISNEAETRYLNARPGVAYVGNSACAKCHSEIAASFHKHPMGRSLSLAPPEGLAKKASFKADAFDYSVESREGHVMHQEKRRDAVGRVVTDFEAEVRYVLGSGTRGYSFLIERDGHLLQSPIAWYSQRGRWDLTPGYSVKNDHFERQVSAECLFCHANQVKLVGGTSNRYEAPIFRGLAIGCERCHGPGELHVKRPPLMIG